MEHLRHLVQAVRSEAAWQARELRDALSRPRDEQIELGVAFPSLRAEWGGPAGRGRSLWLLRGVGLHNGLDVGDPVAVRAHGSSEALANGWIVARDRLGLEVEVDSFDEPPEQVDVVARFDPITFNRQVEALERGRELGSDLAKTLRGERPVAPVPEYVGLPPQAEGLLPAQQRALRDGVGAEVLSVIHGPPGTGKTRVVVALLQAWVGEGRQPLALADSNAAVDHLVSRASQAGLSVVRLGHPGRVHASVLPHTLSARLKNHALAPVWAAVDKEIASLRGVRGREASDARKRAIAERADLREQAVRAIIESADVVACTLGSLAKYESLLEQCSVAVVDEATQATEPSLWIPVPMVDRLVLVGDPFQLGPVVKEPGNPLQNSLLHRWLELPLEGLEPQTLRLQHRMHPKIAEMVRPVYGESYEDAPEVLERTLSRLVGVDDDEVTSRPVHFIDTAGIGMDDEVDPVSRSRFHRGEVAIVAEVVNEWLKRGVTVDQIGVITPYSAQVARLEAALPEGIDVASVQSFQGQEREAIVASFVRSNGEGELGFVADDRRLTVTLSRARRAFVGVGDSATLARFKAFQVLFDQLEGMEAMGTAWDAPWYDAWSEAT